MTITSNRFVRAASLETVRAGGCQVLNLEGHTLAIFAHGERVYAIDNRCPHMGFPLDRGTVHDGILTCHWHHARFDLESGGTFDLWADDVRAFPVELRGDEVWVDLSPHADPRAHLRQRLRDGLERNLSLVIAKASIGLLGGDDEATVPFGIGVEFGTRYRQPGWGQGLTILGCMQNLLPHLAPEDRPRALYHGLSAVANDTQGHAARFQVNPLPTMGAGLETLKGWFRDFIEVRDPEGAERCIVSAVRSGADHRAMADMLFAAATDHRYIQGGHTLDFTNKAFEVLDRIGWQHAEAVLSSLAANYANASRMEESNAWRHPADLVAVLERAFEELPAALEAGRGRRGAWHGANQLEPVLLGERPIAITEALLEALRHGASELELAACVAQAAATRIARFHTSNEFGDWDTALHTYTFANATQQGLKRAPSVELLRAVFDAAMSVYLDRFLNVPAARLVVRQAHETPQALLESLPALFDRQAQVNEAGGVVEAYLERGGAFEPLLAMLGGLLLREDRDFHTIQTIETAFAQFSSLRGTPHAITALVAAARYLAAHAPTLRAQGQTYGIARRLHQGERLFEDA